MEAVKRVAPARKVRIVMPAYSGDPCEQTARFIRDGALALQRAGIELEDFDPVAGLCYIDLVRNILAKRFLDSDATDLLWVDDDVASDPESMVRICQSTRPFVAGIYPKKTDPLSFPVTPVVSGGGMWSDSEGLVECQMVPTGFLRINRAVFEAIKPRVPTFGNSQHGPLSAFFLCAVRDGEYWGEDVEFCRLWREAGGQIHAFVDMPFVHVDRTSGKEYAGNWGDWLRERKAAA
jgi:hypothetical protein